MKRFLLLFLFSFAVNSYGEAPNELRIGALLHLSGEWAPQGQAFLEGLQLAAEEINSRENSRELQVKLIVQDTKYLSAETNRVASKLLHTDKVHAAVVTTLSEAKVAAPLFQRVGVPIMTLWDSSPELEKMGRGVFAIGTWAPSSGEVSAQFAYEKLKARRAVVIDTTTEWSLSVSTPFQKRFTALGGKVLKVFSAAAEESDFRTILTTTRKLQPDVIYSPVDGNIIPFYRQRRMLGIKTPTICSDVIAPDSIEKAPQAFEGIYQTQTADPDLPKTQELLKRYQQRFGKSAGFPLFVAWGYDGMMMLSLAAQSNRITSAQITKQLYRIQGYDGRSGEISINKFGSSRTPVRMFQVQEQRLQLLP